MNLNKYLYAFCEPQKEKTEIRFVVSTSLEDAYEKLSQRYGLTVECDNWHEFESAMIDEKPDYYISELLLVDELC